MSAPDETTQRDPLDLLAEEFLKRHRQGPVDVEAFAQEHPAHAEGLRELLPTLIALEDVKRERASSGSGRGRVSLPALTQLGDFRIVGELGRGGMGVVFDAVQESLGRRVALKVLPQASLLTGNQLERFRREAHIAAQLHHSNIVPVFGSGESDGYHWYAMQFIAGDSLERWRQLQAEAPPRGTGAWRNRARFCARIGIQAASALHYAHGQGTLHRDIKPANLLLDANEHLWVTDFGLAKALEAEGLTHSGDLLGTLQYMAPEQFEGSYDVRSEVYALGVTLYEVLVLRAAFAGKTRSELMERIRTQRPEPLRRLCPEVPEDLVVVVEKAMAREPNDRYRDAHELEQDLQAFLEDRPIQARRHSAPALVLRWCRRNRAMAALAASTVLAVVGAGVYGWIAYGVTNEALVQTKKAETEASAQAKIAAQQSDRAEKNLQNALLAFGKVFDALVGPDPALTLEEDEETGDRTVAVRTVVDEKDVTLLKEMLAFYGQFAEQNAGNQALQLETARANRRVGAICARLGTREDLETAVAAYKRALTGLRGLPAREREIANVLVDLGQLEQRRRGRDEAERLYGEALALLAALPNASTKGVRVDRARAHLLLVQSLLPGRPGGLRLGGGQGGGPGGPGGGGGGPSGGAPPDRERERERMREAREQLQQVVPLIDGLLAEEPANADYRVMKARAQMLAARAVVRRPEGGRRDPAERQALEQERERLEQSAVGLLREVVTAHPERDAYRHELVLALLESRGRWNEPGTGRGRGGDRPPGLDRGRPPAGDRPDRERPPGGDRPDRERPPAGERPDRERVVGDEELAVLREASEHANRLGRELPQVLEYRQLAASVGARLGNALCALPADTAPAVAAVRRQEAEAVLRMTLAKTADDVFRPGAADPRFLFVVLELRRELVLLYLATDRRAEAEEQFVSLVELIENQVAALPAGDLPPGLRRLLELVEEWQPQSPDKMPGLSAPALQRLAALRTALRQRLRR